MSSTARIPVPSSGLAKGITATAKAAMDGDLDGARLCLAHVRELTTKESLAVIDARARALAAVLGPVGSRPAPGLGQAIVDLVNSASA
ncbi:hypothetical protein KPL74_01860 [Bacillus sp. NP157]|nr:hypothetical protein KPL74_01860 [Bacillus sp. NP157]